MSNRVLQGSLDASGLRIGVIVSRFNEFITEQLAKGALEVLQKHGCRRENIHFVRVPGAWELPIAAKHLIPRCDAIVALGAVVRGDTPHFDYVAGGAADGLQRVSLDSGVPIAFGVLTTDTLQQAMDRAGGKSGNKGSEAAEVAIELANLTRQLKERQ
jgi:6,7-dimethyl-8-ribityllumazine synthase